MPERLMVVDDSDKKTIAFVMMMAGVIIWFLIGADKPLAQDLIKGISFFMFAYGAVVLSKQKPWSQLSQREKKMRLWFMLIIALLLILTFVVLVLIGRS
jgi:predicted nucleic acid-binding Zn ribbon protein